MIDYREIRNLSEKNNMKRNCIENEIRKKTYICKWRE